MRRKVMIWLLLVLGSVASGQQGRGYFYHDSLTYSQYLAADWKSLEKSGLEAIAGGFDFYYMRMRVGISYYERGLYLRAAGHFRKALGFNAGDPVAMEYLYYCYLFSGYYWHAMAVAWEFTPSTASKTGQESMPGNSVTLSSLYNSSNSNDIVEQVSGSGGIPEAGNLVIPLSWMYGGISMSHDLYNGTGIIHSLSFLNRRNSLFTNDGNYLYNDYEQNVRQLQYNFAVTFNSRGGFSFTPALFLASITYPMIGFDTNGMQVRAYRYTLHEFNAGAGFQTGILSGGVALNVNGFVSRQSFTNHFQGGASLLIYPAGNRSVRIGGAYNYKLSGVQGEYNPGYVGELFAGVSIAGVVHADVKLLKGDIKNYAEYGGAVVYNSVNEIGSVYKLDLAVTPGTKGTRIFLGGRYTYEYSAFIPEELDYSTESEYNLKSITITGGISWTF